MSRYMVILFIVLITAFLIVTSSYYLFRRTRTARGRTRVRQGSFDFTKFVQTKYKHNESGSDGTANLINQEKECLLWNSGDRIIGGMNALYGDFPCIALLEYQVDYESYSFDCGGSLINHRYVITAAHCLFNKNLVNVRLGEYDLSRNPDYDENNEIIPEPINVGVEKQIIHVNYSAEESTNDIALIRLKMDVPYKQFSVQPICIPDSTIDTPAGGFVQVVGWGNTGKTRRSTILQKVGIKIVEFAECQKKVPNPVYQFQLCAGGEKGKDACTRDSGGPLVMIGGTDRRRTYIVGIVSYGYGCAVEGTPGIYTRVAYYHDWILANLQP